MNTTKRGIPLKIENDSIIDSIIFLKFETDFNQKKIESVLVSFLKKTFSDNPFFSTPLRKKDTESMDNHEKDGQFYSNGVVKVLVDGISKNNPDNLCGYSEHLKLVHFPSKDMSLVGKIVNVKITEGKTWFALGELVE